MFLGGQSQETRELPTGLNRRMSVTRATSAVAVIRPTPGTVCNSLSSGHVGRQRRELPFDRPHICFEHVNLVARGRETRVQQRRNVVGSTSSSRTRGTTWCAPAGIKRPNSLNSPRTVFSRAVRVASHVDRRQCNDAMAWWSTS